jgi:exosortase
MILKTSKSNIFNRLAQTKSQHTRALQYVLCTVLLATAVCLVYGNDLQILMNEALQSEPLNNVLIIPFLAAFLIYLKRDTVRARLSLDDYKKKTRVKYVDTVIGVAICLAAFLLHWYGSNTFYPLEYHILSLPFFLIGLTLIMLNLKVTLTLAIPLLFLLFLVPIPLQLIYGIGGAMANINTQASFTLLRATGIPVTLTTALGSPTITVNTTQGQQAPFGVDLPCSGIYTLVSFASFAIFLALVTVTTIARKAMITALGFLTFEVLNILRISTTISIAYWFGQEAAMVLFHSVAGLILTFAGMFLTLLVSEKLFKARILGSSKTPECPVCTTDLQWTAGFCSSCGKAINHLNRKISKESWAKLFVILLASSIVTLSINAPTFAVAQVPTGLTSRASWENATTVFPQIPDYELSFWYRDTAYEKVAHQDASLWYRYINYSQPQIYVDVGVATSISNLHNWEVCLISWQTAQGQYPLVSTLDSRDIQLLENVPIIARYLVFTSPYNYIQVTLYWYESVPFNTGITVEQRYVRISLLILTYNMTDYKQCEDQLLPVAQAIASYWEPLKTQSLISLGVPAQQALLVASIIFVAFAETTQYSNEWRKRNDNMRIFKIHASPEEKILLQTIENLHQKERKVKTNTIKEELEHSTGKCWELRKLLKALNRLEEYGFIKKDIRDTNNEPQLVWRI